MECGRNGPEAVLAQLAARQHSVFHRRQAVEAGLTARMIEWRLKSGRWVTVHRAIYRLAGAPVTWRQRVMGACLAAGPGAVASHRSAAALLAIDGFAEGKVTVSVAGLHRVVRGAEVHRLRALRARDVTAADGIPVTTVVRTLVDLAAVAGDDDLEAALDWALREQRVTVAYVRRRLADLGSRGRTGTARLSDLLDDRERHGWFESRRERGLSAMLMAAGLPRPARQYRLLDKTGKLVARFDLSLPDGRIAFEFESYRHHFGRQAWRRDVGRNNGAAVQDWLVFRITEDALRTPDPDFLPAVADAYKSRLGAA